MADLAGRRAAAAAARKDAEAKLTPAILAEKAERDALAADEAATREAERTLRDLDLARRVEAAQEVLGASTPVAPLTIEEYPDSFVVQRNGAAHAKWERKQRERASGNNKVDLGEAAREYAVAAVYDWNGKSGSAFDSVVTHDLTKYLEANPGLVTPITNLGSRLNGVFAEARKSGG